MGFCLHGISDCDTVKKARAWLDAAGVAYAFHDYNTAGVPEAELTGWVDRLGWEALLNRAGTTFRRLPDTATHSLDSGRAVALMLAHPATIRRPVLTARDTLLVGFKPERYAHALTP